MSSLMKPKFIVSVDVDNTVFDMGTPWLNWMNAVCGTNRTARDCLYDYSTGYYFPEFEEMKVSAMDFWKNPNLYDDLPLIDGVYECIGRIVDAGGAIAWNSYCKAGHFSSKVRTLKRRFPFVPLGDIHGFYATKEKGGIVCDFAIDDRYKHLAQYSDKVVKIHHDTIWVEDFECPVDLKSSDYTEIGDFILDLV